MIQGLESIFGKTTKAKVIAIISTHQPIRAKEIYDKMSKSRDLSYQAVHKLIKQLESEKILVKQLNCYQINPKWVTKLKQAIIGLEKALK